MDAKTSEKRKEYEDAPLYIQYIDLFLSVLLYRVLVLQCTQQRVCIVLLLFP